ncbi:nucleotide-diphospho-sugar transferase [Mycena rebaudengoi]|nr:nucleotide-diphospho-sugar transferase [Mycena rebaudengoi]
MHVEKQWGVINYPYTPSLSAVNSPPSQSDPRISTSIIIPTYHERANLKPLVLATFAALPTELAEHTEILFVDDDSRDGTAEEVALLRTSHPTVQLLTRTGERGLSSAHPPTAIPALLTALDFGDTPMALGTRYGRGVSMDASWPLYRRVISWGARILARLLTTAGNPMTGFFAVRRDAFLRAHAHFHLRASRSRSSSSSPSPAPRVRPRCPTRSACAPPAHPSSAQKSYSSGRRRGGRSNRGAQGRLATRALLAQAGREEESEGAATDCAYAGGGGWSSLYVR